MTKKFITSDSGNGKGEFVIPDFINGQACFLGIETGQIYKVGLVCYTGSELTAAKILGKLLENRKLNFFQRRKARKAINEYLLQMKSFKIGNTVKVGGESKLELTKNKVQ